MMFDEVLPALRAGQAIQRTSQPVPWAYLKRSPNGAFHWYGYGDRQDQVSPMHIDHTHLDADDWVVVDEAVALARKPVAEFNCPRRSEAMMAQPRDGVLLDYWNERDGHRVCGYCGSMNPDDFMVRLEAGDVELTPTDKNYKVYVTGAGLSHAKFYFQHLSEPQMLRFIELLNEKRLKLAYPGHFYRMPFFCAPVAA